MSKTAQALAAASSQEKSSGARWKSVGAVVHAVKILEYLSDAAAPVGVTQVARDLKLNPSTCFNILRTLDQASYVQFDPVQKSYAIGFGVMHLVRGATLVGADANLVRPAMEKVARSHEVTVTLWRRISETRIMLMMSALSAGNMRIQMSIGQRLPLLVGAAGRAMTAFSPMKDAEMRRLFNEVRWDQSLSFADYLRQVKLARERGYAVDDGYYARGTASVAVPILNARGAPVLACTGTMFLHQYDEGRAEELAGDLSKLVKEMAKMGDELA